VLVILAMIIYKFLGSHFSQKPIPAKTQESVAPMPPKPQPVAPVPVSLLVPPKPALVDPDLQNRLSALEQGQQNMRSDVTSLSNQLSGISANVTALTTQLEQLNQTISALSSKVEEQSHDIARLTVVRTHKPARPVVRKIIHTKKYNIQAVIPGRAWLIATNGTTLTVREGTVIPGYGTVRLIDPNQGRVLTSSGQVIRFSQDDS